MKKSIGFRLSATAVRILDQAAERLDLNRTAVLEQILREYDSRRPAKERAAAALPLKREEETRGKDR